MPVSREGLACWTALHCYSFRMYVRMYACAEVVLGLCGIYIMYMQHEVVAIIICNNYSYYV